MKKKLKQHITGQRKRRVGRVRSKVYGTAARPRLAIHRSLRYLTAQLIDDDQGHTLVSISQKKENTDATGLGKKMAEMAKEKGVSQVVFDRRHYKYHGRVKSFAEGAREGGLQF